MAITNEYRIEVTSPFQEFWRYNVAIMCGCIDTNGTQTGFTSVEDTIAQIGANISSQPDTYPTPRIITLEAPAAEHIVIYVYIIPHTLPSGRDVSTKRPFPLRIRIYQGIKELLSSEVQINQWSGASIELHVPVIVHP